MLPCLQLLFFSFYSGFSCILLLNFPSSLYKDKAANGSQIPEDYIGILRIDPMCLEWVMPGGKVIKSNLDAIFIRK
jgi:hypothetical protein